MNEKDARLRDELIELAKRCAREFAEEQAVIRRWGVADRSTVVPEDLDPAEARDAIESLLYEDISDADRNALWEVIDDRARYWEWLRQDVVEASDPDWYFRDTASDDISRLQDKLEPGGELLDLIDNAMGYCTRLELAFRWLLAWEFASALESGQVSVNDDATASGPKSGVAS